MQLIQKKDARKGKYALRENSAERREKESSEAKEDAKMKQHESYQKS